MELAPAPGSLQVVRLPSAIAKAGLEGPDHRSASWNSQPSWHPRICATVGAAAVALRQRTRRRISGSSSPLAGIPENVWPLLQRAEEADTNFGWQQIASGLEGWRRALENGRVWDEADGADWPEPALRERWAETLEQLDLPRFTRRYPELIDALLFRLLEIVVAIAEAPPASDSADASSQNQAQPSPTSEASPDAASGTHGERPEVPTQGESLSQEDEQGDASDSLLEELVKEFHDEWSPAVDALHEAEQSFGLGGTRSLANSFTLEEGSFWQESAGWEAATKMRSVLTRMPELRNLVRRLGRRTALQGPRQRLPMEMERLDGFGGVARSLRAPSQVAGLTRSGDVDLMLPVEAQLLVRGRKKPALRALHHSRRMEQALLSYHRASWVEVPTQELRREEARPAAENGPMILCLDTSGSMARQSGAPETFAKALVFECLRQAHQQGRRCVLFAFSTGEELQELELDLSSGGLAKLLTFLQGAFHGGTSLDEVICASVERLLGASQHWRNADILLVTDGEVPAPKPSVMEALNAAREQCGVNVYGIVVGPVAGKVMAGLCSELYMLSHRGRDKKQDDGPLDVAEWKLRCVQKAQRTLKPSMVTHAFHDMSTSRRLASCFAGRSREHVCSHTHPRRTRPARSWGHGRLTVIGTQAEAAMREAMLTGEQRNETADEKAAREARWRERAEAKEREKIQSAQNRNDKGWRWVGGRWLTKEEWRSQEDKIELAFQETRLRHARLELELLRRARKKPADEAKQDAVAVQWADEHLSRYGQDLLSILVLGSQEAARLGRSEFDTDAVLLGVLGTQSTASLFATGLPIETSDPVHTLRKAVEAAVQVGKAEDAVPAPGPDLAFTTTLRKLLETVESERARLGHEEAQPGHMLLVLTSEPFATKSMGALIGFGVDPKTLRPRALQSLGGFFATSKSKAEATLLQRRADAKVQSAARRRGQPLAGLGAAYEAIQAGLIERSVEVKLLLLAALAGEHLFLLGAPGTAKSLVARRLAKVCQGSFFERLLTRFTVPEEIFGPLSLQALEQDEIRRKTSGYLPESDVAFIDEIFKANSSILNALLTILNERCFDNGDARLRVPLWCAVAASNELPDTDELDALYDRFLIRRCVRRVSAASVTDFMRMALDADDSSIRQPVAADATTTAPPLLSIDTTAQLQAAARSVEFPDALLQIIADLRDYLAEEAEPPVQISDRRLFKAVRLIRVAAAATGASMVVESDLLLLRHVFWDREPEQGELAFDWLLKRFCEDGSDQKAWTFLLQGIRARLRSDVQGPALEAVLRDLVSLREAAMTAFDRQLRLVHDLPKHVDDGDAPVVDRFFWLSDEERREAAMVGKKAAHGADALAELLVEASVLEEAIAVEDEDERRAVLFHLVGAPQSQSSMEEEDGEIERDEWGDPI